MTLNDKNDWADHTALYEKCFGLCERYTLKSDDINVNVVGGDTDQVGCFSPEVKISLPIGENERVTTVTAIKPFIYAPVTQKEIVGTVRYYYGSKEIASSPIYTKLSVGADSKMSVSAVQYYYEKLKALVG